MPITTLGTQRVKKTNGHSNLVDSRGAGTQSTGRFAAAAMVNSV